MSELLLFKYRELFDGTFIAQRSTYLSDVDQLAAIQLSVLILQKQVSLYGALSSKELFNLQKKISLKKLGLLKPFTCSPFSTPSSSGILDIVAFDDIYRSYNEFMNHCNMLDKTDVKLFVTVKLQNNDEGNNSEIKNHLEDGAASTSCKHLFSPVTTTKAKSMFSPIPISPKNISSPLSPFSPSPKDLSDLQLHRVLMGYFQLVVNSRNEIALARVIDVPTRGIDHKTFTEIRKLASDKEMPMYQVIASFVRQSNLGGKGYAPNEHHVLFKHKESLVEFMDLMDKLQTIVDEGETIISVLTLMLKLLKTSLIRAKFPVFSAKTVSSVIQELLDIAKTQFMKKLKKDTDNICLMLRNYLDFMSCLAGNGIGINSSRLCGILSSPQENSTTFKKISTLMTNFTTPTEVTEETPRKQKYSLYDNDGECEIVNPVETPVSSKDDCSDTHQSEDIVKPITLIRCPINKNITNGERKITNAPRAKSNCRNINEDMSPKNHKQVLKDRNVLPVAKKRSKSSQTKSKYAKKLKLPSALPTGQKTLNLYFTKQA